MVCIRKAGLRYLALIQTARLILGVLLYVVSLGCIRFAGYL